MKPLQSKPSVKHAGVGEDLAFDILNACRQLVGLVHRTSRATEKELGLSSAQLYVLTIIVQAESTVSVNELALITRTHQSSVSVVVKKLLEKGLIAARASKEDGRRLEIRALAKGRRMIESSGNKETLPDTLLKAIRGFEESEAKDLKRLLDQLLKATDASLDQPTLFLDDD